MATRAPNIPVMSTPPSNENLQASHGPASLPVCGVVLCATLQR